MNQMKITAEAVEEEDYVSLHLENVDTDTEALGVTIRMSEKELVELQAFIGKFILEQQIKRKEKPVFPQIQGVEWHISTIMEKRVYGIKTPFNGAFVESLKKATPSAVWNREKQIWWFTPYALKKVVALAEEFYRQPPVRQRVTLSFNRDNPTIDGSFLFVFNRDRWTWHRETMNNMNIVILENNISSGGSAKNPGMYGNCVIEVTCRENAVFSPEPISKEVIDGNEE